MIVCPPFSHFFSDTSALGKRWGYSDVVMRLLEAGADVHVQTEVCITVFSACVLHVCCLVQLGASLAVFLFENED